MEHVVTITSQGQLTIPKALRNLFGITGTTKVTIRAEKNQIVVEPKGDFWSLGGSLKSSVRLNDLELKNARKAFAQNWPQKI